MEGPISLNSGGGITSETPSTLNWLHMSNKEDKLIVNKLCYDWDVYVKAFAFVTFVTLSYLCKGTITKLPATLKTVPYFSFVKAR